MPEPPLNDNERGLWWALAIAPPFFALLAIGLPLTSTPENGDEWGKAGLIFGSLAFLVIWTIVVSRPLLKDLARRGAWVPPGTARHPVLVAFAIPILIHAVLGTVAGVEIWLMRLCGLVS